MFGKLSNILRVCSNMAVFLSNLYELSVTPLLTDGMKEFGIRIAMLCPIKPSLGAEPFILPRFELEEFFLSIFPLTVKILTPRKLDLLLKTTDRVI